MTQKITAPVTALEPVLDDEGVPDFLKRPFPDEEPNVTHAPLPGEGAGEQVRQLATGPTDYIAEFRSKNPYTPRDLEVIAAIQKEQEQGSRETQEAKKAAKQSKREEEAAEQERRRLILIKLRQEQGVQKQEWDE